jgi:hypothetical protein
MTCYTCIYAYIELENKTIQCQKHLQCSREHACSHYLSFIAAKVSHLTPHKSEKDLLRDNEEQID